MDEIKFPFDSEFIKSIAALVLKDKKFVLNYRHLVLPTYFDNIKLVKLVKAIYEFTDKYGVPPSILSLKESLKEEEDFELLSAIIDELDKISLENIQYTKEKIIDFILHQSLRLAIRKSELLLKKKDYDSILDEVSKAYAVKEDTDSPFVDFFDTMDATKEFLTDENQHLFKIGTFINGMDRILRGGVYPGELHVLFAPKKQGKSIFLVNLAIAALYQGKHVLFVTLEIREPQLMARFHSRVSGIPDNELVNYETKWRRSLNRIKRMKGSLKVLDRPSDTLTIGMLKKEIERYIREFGHYPDLLIVDYLDILKPSKKYEKNWESQGPLSVELRGLLGEFELCGWTVTQGKSGVENKEELLTSDMAGDSVKGMTVDSLWSLHQNEAEAKENIGRIKCNLLRVGAGMGDVINVKFDKKKMLISDIEQY